jgi:hypothetical protein
MNDAPQHDDFKLHIEMWRHYDILRQAKNSAFLTANSILVALTGFLLREPTVALILPVSLLGIAVCISWLLLLKRNSTYIEYHRTEAGGKKLWMPPNAGAIRSKWLDQVPAAAFSAFWIGALMFVIFTRYKLL